MGQCPLRIASGSVWVIIASATRQGESRLADAVHAPLLRTQNLHTGSPAWDILRQWAMMGRNGRHSSGRLGGVHCTCLACEALLRNLRLPQTTKENPPAPCQLWLC